MLSVFQQYNLDMIRSILKYCSSKEVYILRKVSRSLRDRIPSEWEYEKYLVNHVIPKHSTNRFQMSTTSMTSLFQYIFIQRLIICETKLKQVHIHISSEYLVKIVIACCFDLKEIYIPKLPALEEILINEVPQLKHLDIHPGNTRIQSIRIYDTGLDHLNIHSTWINIKEITIIHDTGKMNTLKIPQECTQIKSVELAGNQINVLWIYPILDHHLRLFSFRMPIIQIKTPIQNKSKFTYSQFLERFEFEYF
jgi:hypothetical protein